MSITSASFSSISQSGVTVSVPSDQINQASCDSRQTEIGEHCRAHDGVAPNNLPHLYGPFIGRNEELHNITRRLAFCYIVMLLVLEWWLSMVHQKLVSQD